MNRVNDALYSALYPRLPVITQNWACTIGGWMRFRRRFTRHFHRTLEHWERTAQWSDEQLCELQRKRLDARVTRAREHVPYYRDLPPPSQKPDAREAIHETLKAIPPLEKRAYRDQPSAFVSRLIPRTRLLAGQTSGTTGSPKGVTLTHANVCTHAGSLKVR